MGLQRAVTQRHNPIGDNPIVYPLNSLKHGCYTLT